MRIAFLGTPTIAATVLEELLKDDLNIDAVVTQPDRPSGRGGKIQESAVKIIAQKNKIPVYQPGNKQELTTLIKELAPDLCIVAAYGMMIPDEALDAARYGMINFHPSLLPELRGPSPIPMAIICGHNKTGVSIIQITKKMDAGDILAQSEVLLEGTETTPSLSSDLAKLGAKMLIKVVEDIRDNRLEPAKQNEEKATFSPLIKKADGEIVFGEYHAKNIEQAARAFTPWPGIFTTWGGKKLELIEPQVVKGTYESGLVSCHEDKIIIGCVKDAIAPKFFKLEGKRLLTAKEFLCGYRNFIGSKLK